MNWTLTDKIQGKMSIGLGQASFSPLGMLQGKKSKIHAKDRDTNNHMSRL
jgi:hypothetical protein